MADFNNMNDNIKIYNLEPYVLIDGVSGTYNIAQGQGALCANTIGNFNIGSGLGALNCNETGCHNIAIGPVALNDNITGNTNVAIGCAAGFYETGSNKLHIANCQNCTLICGDFANKTVQIDGCVCATCAIQPASGADGSFPNNSIYYSTTASKLVYKDSGGTVNDLY